MPIKFIPDDDQFEVEIPYFEDATGAEGVIGYSTQQDEAELQEKIRTEIARVGGRVESFQKGKYKEESSTKTMPDRYGYQILFSYQNADGRINVATLPIKNETPARKRQAHRQALYTIWKMLQSHYNCRLNMPNDTPLIPYLLDDKGRTLLEAISAAGILPQLPSPTQKMEGGFDPDDENVVDGEAREID
jgi:hypothetical protein